MRPDTQAVQVFYGTVPLIVVILGVWFREQMLLKDILARLGRIETKLDDHGNRIGTLESQRWR